MTKDEAYQKLIAAGYPDATAQNIATILADPVATVDQTAVGTLFDTLRAKNYLPTARFSTAGRIFRQWFNGKNTVISLTGNGVTTLFIDTDISLI